MINWYKLIYGIVFPAQRLIFPIKAYGRENIIEGAAVVCANHSSVVDVPLIAFTFTTKQPLFFMSKREILEIPIIGAAFKRAGVYPVSRDAADITAVRTSMLHLKNNEKIMIFPEGTRVTEIEASEAKTGAVRIAAKMKCPIIPIYVERKKRAFRRNGVYIGKPFYVQTPKDKNFEPLADLLMEKIYELEPKP